MAVARAGRASLPDYILAHEIKPPEDEEEVRYMDRTSVCLVCLVFFSQCMPVDS